MRGIFILAYGAMATMARFVRFCCYYSTGIEKQTSNLKNLLVENEGSKVFVYYVRYFISVARRTLIILIQYNAVQCVKQVLDFMYLHTTHTTH